MTDYVVKQGDCLSSIAHQFGFTWQKLWNDPSNAELRAKRKNPNVLYPGDVVHIPEIEPKAFRPKTNAWNRYVVQARKAYVRVRLLVNGTPLSSTNVAIAIDDGPSTRARTDDDGTVELAISPDARRSVITLENGLRWVLDLGGLDPLETPTGLQARLRQLGYYFGPVDGLVGPLTEAAVRAFQSIAGLEPTGKIDDATLQRLKAAFGC